MTKKAELLAAFKAAVAAAPKLVKIDGFPDMYVRLQTVGEVDAMQLAASKGAPDAFAVEHKMAHAIGCFICDAEGRLVFNVDDKQDQQTLVDIPWAVGQKLLQAVNIGDEIQSGN